jgi:hypothetical protein
MPDPLVKSSYRRFREANTGWLRRIGVLLIASLLVLAFGVASANVLVNLTETIRSYRSPLAKFPAAGDAGEPLTPQVVLVVIEGLRADQVALMPTLQRIREQGASATVEVPFPMSQSALTTLLSGAGPEINDAPLLDADIAHVRPIRPETVFTTARRANLNTAVAGPTVLQALIPAQFMSESYFASDSEPAVADNRANDAAIAFISNFSPNLVLVNYTMPESAAKRAGVLSREYRQALEHSDQLLAQLFGTMNMHGSVLVVTSSFGNIDRGGHGGDEKEVTRVPLVLSGARIKSGAYPDVRQQDIAPTVAALAGGGIPSTSQGSILFSMLDMNDVQRATKALALAQQQREYGIAYLVAIGGALSEAALNDPPVARSSFAVKNYPSAFSLANLSVLQVQHDTEMARLTRILRERVARAPMAIALLSLPLLALWFRRGLRLVGSVLIAIGIVGVYHWAYLDMHHLYSFSDVGTPDAFLRDSLQRAALALLFGGLLVTIFHWRDRKPSRQQVARTFLEACGIAIFLGGIPFVLGYFFVGLGPVWYLGSPLWTFIQIFSLTAIVSLTALAVPLAAVAALVYWLALIVVHRFIRLRWVGQITLRLKNLPASFSSLFTD